MEKQYYVYIITNKTNTVLYTVMTNDLARRITEHQEKTIKGFAARYNLSKLVYYEVFEEPYDAIYREKQIKGGPRRKKRELVESVNPEWRDLSEELW